MSDYPETIYWLTLINESGLKLNLIKPVILRWCVLEKRSLAGLFELSPLEWSTTFGLPDAEAELATAARNKLARQAAALARWQAQGIEPIIRTDPRYPRRWTYILPPASQPLILWARGEPGLLNEPAVAILGGDQALDESSAEVIDELMQVLVAENIGLVSGYGRGLDRATFEVMMATEGGHAVVILPMGLSAFVKTTSKLEGAVEAGKIALVSPFAPNTSFQENFAAARNILIDHLASSLLVLHADEDTQTRASAALDQGLPVLIAMADTAGNRALMERGALLLTDPGEVVEMVQQAMIDAALVEQAEDEATAPDFTTSPATSSPASGLTGSNDDYALRIERVEPIDSDEALQILSMGGEVPEVLRRRLKKSGNGE